MEHTKGPWNVSRTMIFAENPYGKDDMHIADVRGWGHLTGKGGGCGFPDKKAEQIQDANAALIAAAPDLLEALKLLSSPSCGSVSQTQEMMGWSVNDEIPKAERLKRAKKAIEKAEGK